MQQAIQEILDEAASARDTAAEIATNNAQIIELTKQIEALRVERDAVHALPNLKQTSEHPEMKAVLAHPGLVNHPNKRAFIDRVAAVIRTIPEDKVAAHREVVERIGEAKQKRAELIERNKELGATEAHLKELFIPFRYPGAQT